MDEISQFKPNCKVYKDIKASLLRTVLGQVHGYLTRRSRKSSCRQGDRGEGEEKERMNMYMLGKRHAEREGEREG